MELKIKTKTTTYTYEAVKEVTTVGRSSDNDFVVPLEDMSRKHFQITIKGSYFFIMDLGSKNGVTVDGKRLKPHEQYTINKNSKIMIANLFHFLIPDSTSPSGVGLNLETLVIRGK
jgi:pSer/pThr/pTyr-binding forkhead associated (FHA) protein